MKQASKVSTKNLHFPGQQPDEKVDLTMRRHPFYLAYNLFIIFLGLLVLIFAYFSFPNQIGFFDEIFGRAILTFVFILALMFIFLVSFAVFIHYYLDMYLLTNHRIMSIDQVDFFHRTVNEAAIDKVQDLEVVTKGFFATLLDFGDIKIQTAGAQLNTIVFRSIPHPHKVKELILDLAHHKNRHRMYKNPKQDIIT